LALLLFGLLVGLAATEGVLRVALPAQSYQFPVSRITDDRFSQRAGQVINDSDHGVRYSFDASGFRTTGAIPPPASRTVLFVGDSFTQGFGVNDAESFPAVTCDRLAERGVNARCLNAGTTGFGTAHELRLLQRLLQRDDLVVDAVVFQVLPNNDLRDNWEDGGFEVDGGELVVRDPPKIPAPVWWRDTLLNNSLARGSRLVVLAANAWFSGEGLDLHYDAPAFALERRLLQEVVATTQKRSIPIVIVVTATGWELGLVQSQPFDERARLDFVTAVVQALGVPYVDARNVANAPEHYIAGDGHYSVAGNALIAQALAPQLELLLRR
jgi:lysophospholipase L1-like esterase